MTQYKPFWTEQSATTTTTTNPTEDMETSNEHILFIFAVTIAIIVMFISVAANNYYKGQKELEFVKAGLVQKVENGKVIWTKP
jgi:hypothetical protein